MKEVTKINKKHLSKPTLEFVGRSITEALSSVFTLDQTIEVLEYEIIKLYQTKELIEIIRENEEKKS